MIGSIISQNRVVIIYNRHTYSINKMGGNESNHINGSLKLIDDSVGAKSELCGKPRWGFKDDIRVCLKRKDHIGECKYF